MYVDTHISVKSFVNIFDVLESMRSDLDLDKGDWAELSELKAPRLSEIYRLVNAYKDGVFDQTKIGRALTASKLTSLIEGMMKRTGKQKIIQKLIKKLNETDDLDSKLQIYFTICNLIDKEKLLKSFATFVDIAQPSQDNSG